MHIKKTHLHIIYIRARKHTHTHTHIHTQTRTLHILKKHISVALRSCTKYALKICSNKQEGKKNNCID